MTASGVTAAQADYLTQTYESSNPTTATLGALTMDIASGAVYQLAVRLIARTGLVAQGLKIGLTFPAQVHAAFSVRAPQAGAIGLTGPAMDGFVASNGAMVTMTTAPTANADFPIHIDGSILCSGSGKLQVLFASELTATNSGVTLRKGSSAICWQIISGLSV